MYKTYVVLCSVFGCKLLHVYKPFSINLLEASVVTRQNFGGMRNLEVDHSSDSETPWARGCTISKCQIQVAEESNSLGNFGGSKPSEKESGRPRRWSSRGSLMVMLQGRPV